MTRLRILVFAGAPIFPISGMHQVRIINQMKSLAESHDVTFGFLYNKSNHCQLTKKGLMPFGIDALPLQTFTQSFIFRLLAKFFIKRFFSKMAMPFDHFAFSNTRSAKKIAKIINEGSFDVVISHYWDASGFLLYVKGKTLKCIDTHYLVEENLELFANGRYQHLNTENLGKLLMRERELQWRYFNCSDLLIVNSDRQSEILLSVNSPVSNVCIPNGQDLSAYMELRIIENPEKLKLLFYGSLSNQFNGKALRRLIDVIYPVVYSSREDIELVIMGSSPPEWLITLAERDSRITVTGFVENPAEVFQTCFCCVIPLDSGSGFRGRTIELMASGVPIVGTHNALDSVGIVNGVNGVIDDDDRAMADAILRLAKDDVYRVSLAQNARSFVNSKFSLEETHGRLGKYLSDKLN